VREGVRIAVGGLAALAIGGMALALPSGGPGQQRAVLSAAQVFTLSQPEPGLYQWSLLSGPAPEGAAVVSRDELLVDRGDRVELRTNGLEHGAMVTIGTELAGLTSASRRRQLKTLQANLQATQARRDRLEQGGDIEIGAARQRVRVAQARREVTRVELNRIQSLHTQGAASDADLNDAELADRVSQTEVALAQAEVSVAGSISQPAALAEVDARLTGIANQIEEIKALTIEQITSPIDGQLSLSAGIPTETGMTLLSVQDSSTVFARFPIEETLITGLTVGDKVRFTGLDSSVYDAELVALSDTARTLNSQQVFWASARIDNPDGALLPGTSGTVHFTISGYTGGSFGSLWRTVIGP
jgi:hypothetical protein